MERLSRATAIALCALMPCAAHAGEETFWYVQADNDVFFESDRWYTNGLRIARAHRSGDHERTEWGIVQEIYTPDSEHLQPGTVERPYGARLYLSGARHYELPGRYRTLELTAGVRGPAALGRQLQEFVHRFVPAPHQDWSRQLPNRLDAQAIASQSDDRALFAGRPERLALHYGIVAGTQVAFVHAGFSLRAGPAQVANPALRFAATPPAPLNGARGWGAFGGASVRWIARNALLSQNENLSGPPLELNRGVLRLAVGLTWTAAWGGITLAAVQDTREFDTQIAMPRYGVVTVRFDTP